MKKQIQLLSYKITFLDMGDYCVFWRQLKYLIAFSTIIIITSCRQDQNFSDAEKVVAEWMGKTIYFPSDVRCTYMGKDTAYTNNRNTPYKIVLYTDSLGCLSCKLQLYKWNSLIKEANALMPGKVSFLFYFHPKNEKELQSLLRKNDFKQSVFIDNEGKLNAGNNLPENMKYQCFLLDNNNKVILLGNPTTNPNIWSLYKEAITGEECTGVNDVTTVKLEQGEGELKGLKVHETVTGIFVLENTGNIPLLIGGVTTSCGCTIPEWDQHPIMPGAKTEIKVKVTPDASGYLWKTATVFCNIKKGFIRLTIKGRVAD